MQNRIDLLLINPPYSNVFTPLLGTPCLTGFLNRDIAYNNEHVLVEQLDLNILHFKNMIIKRGAQCAAYLLQRDYVESLPQEQKLQIQYSSYEKYIEDGEFLTRGLLSIDYIKSILNGLNLVQLNILDLWLNLVTQGSFATTIEALDFDPDNLYKIKDANELLLTLYSCPWFSLQRQMPRIVGMSVSFEAQMPAALLYAKTFKEMAPDIKIIMGGSYIDTMVSFNNEKFIRNTLKNADFLSFHEGETSLKKLIQHIIFQNINLEDVPNIIFCNEDGTITKTKLFLENVSELPLPDFTGLNLEDYLIPGGMVPYQTSRGCFYAHCAFCAHDKNYRGNYRIKPVEKCLAELELIKKQYGCKHIIFVDEAIEYRYFAEMVNLMDKRDTFRDLNWMFYSRVDKRYNEDIICKAYRNGCRMVLFGVETFSQRLLNFIKKGISADAAINNLKMFCDAGIKTFIWMMYGLPSQTTDEVLYDIEKIIQNKENITSVALSLFGFYPSTDMYKNPLAFNIVNYEDDNPYKFTSHFEGKIVNRSAICELAANQYYPFIFRTFGPSNRFLTYIKNTKEINNSERNIDRLPILNALFQFSEKQTSTSNVLSLDLQYKKLQNYVKELSNGKDWLESQYNNYKCESERKDGIIEELQSWTHQLEEAKEWLVRQYEDNKAENERKDRIIEDLLNG